MNTINVKKPDCRFWGDIALFVILLYSISSCVYLNGDDFMYGTFAKTGIIHNVTNYYFTGNGRFWINILDSVLLWFDRYAFIVVLPWIVLAFIVLFAKNVQRIMCGYSDWHSEKRLIRMGMVLFTCLDVMCLRETVFWITGMMNYLFPATLFLLGYLLFQKSRNGEIVGFYIVGYYFVCVLASSSVEQYALMFVGMMTLHHGYDLLKKVRIPVYEWIAYGLALVGLCLLIFAPGNFVRVDTHGSIMPSFIDNAWTLFSQDIISYVAFPYIVMLFMAVMLYKASEDVRGKIWVYTASSLIGWMFAYVLDKAILYIVLLLVIGGSIIIQLIRSKAKFCANIYFLIVVGSGSQVMLLISAVWGYRCMRSLYMVYMLTIGCLLYHADFKSSRFVLIVGALTALHPAVAVIGCIASVAYKFIFSNHPAKVKLTSVLCCVALINVVGVYAGYAQNVATHRENLSQTDAMENDTIIIQELPNDNYSWYMVPFGEFHEEYYRLLHDIPENVEFVYEVLPE